jgi:hypothetical protein
MNSPDDNTIKGLIPKSEYPVEVHHGLKIIWREAITQTPRANHALRSDLGARAVV